MLCCVHLRGGFNILLHELWAVAKITFSQSINECVVDVDDGGALQISKEVINVEAFHSYLWHRSYDFSPYILMNR